MNTTDDGQRVISGVAAQGELSGDARLTQALEEYRALLEAGRPPDREAFLARYPEIADQLAECLSGLEMVHAAAPALSGVAAESLVLAEAGAGIGPGTALGDFRLIREVGRGGMGIVYEAEQASLGRRVALKVLPFAGALDGRQLQRFHNEARAAACLHHTNIVPVYFVGCERGIHFYAMQLIDGRPLSELIRQMHRLEHRPATAPEGVSTCSCPPADGGASTLRPAAEITPPTGQERRRDHLRRAAELGVQAAEALDHAHQLGIVHRDIKPGNLLLDVHGRLWVTDFGLAHVQQAEASLTLTGQAVGTPRYMSPEQALARRVLIDHRTDVYSLGATLYELLTLRPAFESEDRQELLRQIALEEPRPPRRLNKAIPLELETVLLKAMAKSPGERYATAGELADDLRRWLEDRPIRARRPSMRARLMRWGRRHKTLVMSALAALVMGFAVLAGSVGWVVRDRAARQAKMAGDLQSAVEEGQRLRSEGKLPQAQAAAKRAEALLEDGAAGPALAEQVQSLLRELAEEEADERLAAVLRDMRLHQAEVNVRENRFLIEKARPDYQEAFRSYGLSRETMTAEQAAARLRSRPASIRAPLVAALDHWLILARHEKAPETDWLEQVLSLADPDSWRQRMRAARARDDRQALEQLAAEVDPATQPPESLFLLRMALSQRGAKAAALALLRRAQRAFPADFWINHDLGDALLHCQPPQYAEAIRFFTVAAALQPGSPGARLNLGLALFRSRRLEEAAVAFQQAIALDGNYATAHQYMGTICLIQGRTDEAIAACRRAIALKPDGYEAHFDLGSALSSKGRLREAAAAFRRVTELKPDCAEAHCNLGSVLRQQGELVPSLAAFQQGHALSAGRPSWPYPSAQWVREGQRLVELEGRLGAILAGQVQPASASEGSDFAELCFAKQHYLAAARLWADAFQADPKLGDDLVSGRRDEAASAAALAAAGQGADAGRLDSKDRCRWRKQALQWLRADLAAHARLLHSRRREECHRVLRRLHNWQSEYELASLRDPAAVVQLPADEQRDCRQLWADVAHLLEEMNSVP